MSLTLENLRQLMWEIENPPPTLEELEHEVLMLDPIEKAAYEAHEWINRTADNYLIKIGAKKAAYLLNINGQKALVAPPGYLPVGCSTGHAGRGFGMPVFISDFLGKQR